MNEHETRDPLESLLVSAARSQRAPRAARARIRAAVGLAAGASTLAVASAAAAASGKQAAGVLTAIGITKYVAIGVACGVLTLGVTRLATVPASTEAPVSTAPVASSARPREAPVPTPTALPSASAQEPTPEPSALRAYASAAPMSSSPQVPTLAGELAVLDQARGALRGGDSATAILVLDGYALDYPRGQMSAEAMMLRIQALVQSGNRPAAESLARSFERANPKSPLVERVRAIVGSTNP